MEKQHPSKRIFIGLSMAAILLLALLAALLFYMWSHAESGLTYAVHICIAILILLLAVGAALGLLFSVLAVLFPHAMTPVGKKLMHLVLKLYPIVTAIGNLVHLDKDQVRSSFIALNNTLIRNSGAKISADRILILLPHCLQKTGCPYRVTGTIENCAECGGCTIGSIKKICALRGVHVLIVTGGTLARQAAKELRPKAVIAVACPRDLFSGIVDVHPLPSIGVLNVRPKGPCHDTLCDPAQIDEAICFFTGDEPMREEEYSQ